MRLALRRMPVHAQPVFRIAVLIHGTERTYGARVEALRAALKDLGYVEGKNLKLSVRWNEGSAVLLRADEVIQ